VTPSELLEAVLLALGGTAPVQPRTSEAQPRAAATRPLTVLVAEDNRVNQQLIVRMLAKLGHTALLVHDGQEALAALAEQTVDLVLMDVQMPVMDGFTATAAIREREAARGDGRRLPIAALTAHAMKGDRERCLAAGMDDYLSKPVTPEAVRALLARLFDVGPLDLGAGLAYVGGDRALLAELLGIFVDDAPGHLQALHAAMAPFDGDAVARAAHTVKGTARAIGAHVTAGIAERLERAGRAGAAPAAGELTAALEDELRRVPEAVTGLRGTLEPHDVMEVTR
jgi:CheY-like chemotaxis protein